MLNFFEQIEPITRIEPITPVTFGEPTEHIPTDTNVLKPWTLFPWTLDALKELGIETWIGDWVPRSEDSVGTPNAYHAFYDPQDLPYNCSVAVQYCILRAFGVDVTEAELTELALEEGWLTHRGASIEDVGKVLEHYGIDIHCRQNATLAHLIFELERGHSVIIVVDAGELWADDLVEHTYEWLEDIVDRPDHVVWLTGIDLSDPDNPQVIINDTGHPDGAGARYPLAEFKDAWEDGNYTYIATNEAPPAYKDYLAHENGVPNV